MKAMTKVAVISASILSMGALTACQTTTAPQDAKQMKHYKEHHKQRMSPEMREKHQVHQAERKAFFEQAQKACDGKTAGQTVQVNVGEKTVDGTCTIHFKADRKDMKQVRGEHRNFKENRMARGEHRPMHGDIKGLNTRGEPLTDAKRAELTQQYAQRLANRQAQQQAFLKACEGQTHGKAVQVKLGDQAINGQCQVRFQPKMPQSVQPTKAA